MRLRLLVPVALSVLVLAAVGGQAAVGASRDASYSDAVRQLQATWDQDVAAGVPASALAPLRAQLLGARPPSWWSSDWWRNTPEQLIASLNAQTREAWDSALAAARDAADAVFSQAQDLITAGGSMVPASFAAGVADWPAAIAAAPTPRAVSSLAVQYGSELADARARYRAAQAAATARAEADAQAAQAAKVAKYGGVLQLLAAVPGLDQIAAGDNLDDSDVDTLAAQAQQLVDASQDTTDVAARLGDAIAAFHAVISENDQIASAMQPLQWEIEQAVVEATPASASLGSRFQPMENAFTSARTAAQIAAVAQQQAALKTAVDADLAADTCGHSVPAGKVLVVSLSAQEMVAYQDGCAVRATPVTTGRPALPTPQGSYHVFYKTTPFTMVSPWPKGSPFWYPTTPVTWVMEFNAGGYFIHDAAWEAPSAYGPGSEDNPGAASHGCIHIPTPTMQWLYSWTPVGTPVIVEA